MLKFKKRFFTVTLLCGATLMSGFASADPWDRGGDDRGPGPEGRQAPMQNQERHGGHRDRDVGRNEQQDMRGYPNYYHAPSGGQWQQGGHIPKSYWGRNYRVDNWRDNGLPPPPSGHRWLHVDGQYILVAAATGVIASILLHH